MTANPPSARDDLIDLRAPGFATDPFPVIERVRSAGGSAPALFVDTMEATLFVDDEDVRTILGDRRFVLDPANVAGEVTARRSDALTGLGINPDLVTYLTESLLDKDAEDHTRLRKLVSRTFTVRRVNAMRPAVQEIADELIARLPELADGDGVVDLMPHFAYPLPIAVICDLVGVPVEERPAWRSWSERLSAFDPSRPELMNSALGEMVEHIRGMLAARRAEPTDDLLGALVRARDEDGGRLSESELITLVFTLVIAGHETTAHLLGNGVRALLGHPDQWGMLREDPGLLPSAVHEMLRYGGTAVIAKARYAVEDVELRSGRVAAGARAIAVIGGANRDPRVHPEPQRFDITRHHGRPGEAHVGFGHGVHYCLGAALARQEGEIGVGALVSAHPDLSLVPGRGPRPGAVPGALRLDSLPVRL
ncbi:cytochrome P450 [Streptomonospora nanhaiensis]|uniref:Cytochrome P450 n=1 Tax=Streptomonospora nanhaiensis TaxID=1323731 RepID=A0ABY6YJ31_9ACTN|nr:cytochrome P450 [Streptomonospora nanhaiensis]WAE72211.1 cytochrome P450 [Streptomonospora nanhaiensis]